MTLTRFWSASRLGPIFTIAQTVAKPSMRPLASAIILSPGRPPAGGRHDQRRAEKRLWRGRRALFAAVGRGHDNARRAAVRLGRRLDSEQHPAGKLTDRPDSSLALFYLLFFRGAASAPCGPFPAVCSTSQ